MVVAKLECTLSVTTIVFWLAQDLYKLQMTYAIPFAYSGLAGAISASLDIRTFFTFNAYNSANRRSHREDFFLLSE